MARVAFAPYARTYSAHFDSLLPASPLYRNTSSTHLTLRKINFAMAITRSSKRQRDESDDSLDERQPKRLAQTPQPSSRILKNGSLRAPNTAPISRTTRPRTFLGASRNTPGHKFHTATPRMSQKLETSGTLTTINTQPTEADKENLYPVSPKQSSTTPSPSTSANVSSTTDTAARDQAHAISLFGTMVSAAATPIKAFKAMTSWVMRPNADVSPDHQDSTTSPQGHQPSTGSRNSAPQTPAASFRPEQYNIFSGRPSPYAVPTSQAHLLPSTRPKPLTQEEVEKKLQEAREAIYKRNIDAGLASEDFKREYEKEKEAQEEIRTSGKRKRQIEDERSTAQPNRFELTYSESEDSVAASEPGEPTFEPQDHQASVESDPESEPETPLAKVRKTSATATPSRSAMKKKTFTPGENTQPRSAKSVNFNDNPVASTKYFPTYGPAGHYDGFMFADPKKLNFATTSEVGNNSSSLDYTDVISPDTRINTQFNALTKADEQIKYDPSYRDPTDPSWRPTPGRPRPTTFRVPDIDDEDPESILDDESTAANEEATPTAPPASPRPTHAVLPATPTPAGPQDTTSKIRHLREAIEKYKPKSSSSLSHVEPARSRSSSPPPPETTICKCQKQASQPSGLHPLHVSSFHSPPLARTLPPPDLSTITSPPHWYHNQDSDLESDSPLKPKDKLESLPHTAAPAVSVPAKPEVTPEDIAEVQKWDSWAQSLAWPEPLLRTDAGISSSYMENYITSHWTDEDDRQSATFYDIEFAKLGEAWSLAKKGGVEIEFVKE